MRRNLLIFVTFLSLNHYGHCQVEINPTVKTNQGVIRGLHAARGNYSMFLGIPYATIDKNNPFGVSSPHPNFDTVFDAVDDSAVCAQYSGNAPIGTLDCLHMNVFVPYSVSPENPLPVLVWIYGGRFHVGSYGRSRVSPDFLVSRNVIVVTFNYRVGPYGFMCLDTPEVPGNAGLKDQLLALRWVKNNIASFGGDVNKITLGGQSAGSVSVDFHLVYDKEEYFNQAIMNSGSAQCPWAIIDADRNEPIELAKRLGFKTDDFKEAFDFLRKTDPYLVLNAKNELGTFSRPCVEKTFDNVESFITDYPINLPIPRARSMPILTGYTADELLFEYINWDKAFFDDENLFKDELSISFEFGEDADELGEFYRHFYVGDTIGQVSKMKIIDFESDFRFNHAIQRSVQEYLKNGAENVYHYLFSYLGGRNRNRQSLSIPDGVGGATHGDDLGYLLDFEQYRERENPDDDLIIDRMTTLWTNFVKYGNPTPVTTEILPVKWEPVTKEALKYINIDIDMKMDTRPLHQRLTFWDYFYKNNKEAQKGYKIEN